MSEETSLIDAQLTIPGQVGPATVLSVRGVEAIGRPFEYVVAFRCAGVSPDEARGATAILDLAGGRRFVTGVVEALRGAVLPSAHADDTWFEARLSPLPYVLLRYQRGFRIYQELTVVEIVQEILERAGIGDQADWSGVSGTYPMRTYTVQYDESEWDFVSRLFEEVGIFYVFEHDAAGHRMVLMDDNGAARALEPASLPFLRSSEHRRDVPGVWDVSGRGRVALSKVSLRDFDFERPTLDLAAEASAEEVIEREHYAYPGYYQDPAEGARLAQVQLDAFRSERLTARFATNVLELVPGHRFELTDHDLVEGDQLVTEVRIDATLQDMSELGASATERRVDVTVETQPLAQAFRSLRRTPKPKALGLQTAMIAGPPGEEIHVDRFGRVKVQFHWDRQGVGDDKASCWMRVTQQHTTGSVMIPRIGWEVLVEFIDGDPDRPVVLGRVWNPNTPPPHSLPASKTYSVHASVSSPGRGGTNEIVMNDAAGSEKITINAQHDYALAVANNRMLNVGMNLATTVTANRTASIGANETKAVQGNESDSVTGSHTIDVSGLRTVKVTGTATEGVTGSMTFTASGMENIQVGSPAAALLEVVQNAAVAAATGAAAQAANRATATLLAPLAPALSTARAALGPAAQLAGPAAALLGPADPNIAAFSQAAGALGGAPGAEAAGNIAAGFAAGAMNDALAGAMRDAAGGGGGGAGGGAGGGPTGPGGASGGGSGTWGVTVNGAVSESISGVAAYNTVAGIAITIGGSNKETVGAARIEAIRGGKSETTGAAKLETVGIYMIDAAKSYGVDAKAAIALNVAGSLSNDLGGGHSIAAKGPVVITAPSAKLKASGKITLACGACKVVVSSSGIDIEGASEVHIKGSTIELPETALGT